MTDLAIQKGKRGYGAIQLGRERGPPRALPTAPSPVAFRREAADPTFWSHGGSRSNLRRPRALAQPCGCEQENVLRSRALILLSFINPILGVR